MSDDSSVRSSAQSALSISADPAADAAGLVIQKDTPCNQQNNAADDDTYKPLDHPELTQRQLAAIPLLLQGLSDSSVAEQVGVTRITIYRWRTLNATFRQELDRLRRELLAHSADRLRALLHPSLDILANHLHSADPKTSFRAAALIARIATPSRRDLDPVPVSRAELNDIIEAVRCLAPPPHEVDE